MEKEGKRFGKRNCKRSPKSLKNEGLKGISDAATYPFFLVP
ncbi:hypothetical protein JOD02_001646 [Caldicoprobacter guelmensis]|nr:hypothetical protein [Caldicoprobacter guelmensis]MBM7582777.1 hypothetical protein [Caldicoprobacter guelmensis]